MTLLQVTSPELDRRVLQARVEQVDSRGCRRLKNQQLRLSWYDSAAVLHPGDRVQVSVVLKTPRGLGNPGGFNYASWLRGKNYAATGYVKTGVVQTPAPTSSFQMSLDRQKYVHADLLNAMLLGQRAMVSADRWALFRDTGTIHLMVISGLHVGVFFGFVFLATSSLLRLFVLPWAWWVPRNGALLLGLLALLLLVQLVGANPPVIRAAMMAGGVAVLVLLTRRTAWWRLFFWVGLLAVCWHPGVVYQQGFWLSYAAVASLLYVFSPRDPVFTWTTGLLVCQLVLFLALTPWLGVFVGAVPLVSPLANLLVVPVVTLITIPAGMAGLLAGQLSWLASLSQLCLYVADVSLALVIEVLVQLPRAQTSIGFFDFGRAILALLSAVIVLSPMPRQIRLLALFGWLPLLVGQRSEVVPNHFRIQVLDVGQGSAAIVDTHRHRLVVDTGASFPSGFNMIEAAVVPVLRSTGPNAIHRALVTHSDNDHAGGIGRLQALYPDAMIMGLAQPCRSGDHWQWDGVSFVLLMDAQGTSSNDKSCTLLVSNGQRRAYFSGDIGHRVERRILPDLPREIDLLLAPHHGSASSSTPSFVSWLSPRFVVFSAGYDNRYGHPRDEVVARYRRRGSAIYNTAIDGAVTWSSDKPDSVETYR